MGWFDWLPAPKDRVEVAEDRIWLTRQAKFTGIQREIGRILTAPDGPDGLFAVAHFRNCLDELALSVHGAECDRQRVLVTTAESLHDQSPLGTRLEGHRQIYFVVAERHPLPSADETIVEFARKLSCRCRIIYHVSLEDPLMRMFSGEWVEGVLRRLGMKEDEPIASRMVARRLRAAQKKIEGRATGNQPASSAAEWLELNCSHDWHEPGR